MKSIFLIVGINLVQLAALAQHAVVWKVSNYHNDKLQDTFVLVSGKSYDTSVYYIPGVICMCRFGNRMLIADFQEQNISLLPLMSKVMQYSGESLNLDAVMDSMSRKAVGIIPGKDSIYFYKEGNTSNQFKVNSDGEVYWMEITVYETRKIGQPGGTELTRTVYERTADKNTSRFTSLSEYVEFVKGRFKLKDNYTNWEFNNLIIE